MTSWPRERETQESRTLEGSTHFRYSVPGGESVYARPTLDLRIKKGLEGSAPHGPKGNRV